jgi:hypothetical protein
MRIRIIAILTIVFSLAICALADVGPEPGYVRVDSPLVIQPQDDFSAYRFFLNSPGGLEEITVTKGKTTTISTEGRAGTMKYTTLIAVPKAGLADYNAPIAAEKLDALKETISDKKIDGVIELASHTFDAYIKKKEKKKWKNPIYVLKASADKKIEAVETTPSGKTRGEIESGDEGNSHMAATIVAGSFLSLSFIFGGVWFARRRSSPAVQG